MPAGPSWLLQLRWATSATHAEHYRLCSHDLIAGYAMLH